MDIKKKAIEIKDKTLECSKKVIEWCKENPEEAIGYAAIIFAGGKYILKQYHRSSNLKRQEAIKTLYIYDRSHGHYWPLRRELSTREYLEIDRRKDNGEKLRDILNDFGVLK